MKSFMIHHLLPPSSTMDRMPSVDIDDKFHMVICLRSVLLTSSWFSNSSEAFASENREEIVHLVPHAYESVYVQIFYHKLFYWKEHDEI